jgi:hypothetical protein
MLSRLWLLLICPLAGCSTVNHGGAPARLPYRCSDLVVIGRVVTLNDLAPVAGWQSRYQLQVRIKRVLRGS